MIKTRTLDQLETDGKMWHYNTLKAATAASIVVSTAAPVSVIVNADVTAAPPTTYASAPSATVCLKAQEF